MEGQEQNRSEEATPFKLKRAREKGQVARGTDLGFVGSLLALAAAAVMEGPAFAIRLRQLLRLSFASGIARATDPSSVFATVRVVYWQAFQPLVVLGIMIVALLVFLELLQLRGFIFTATPLKPDFTRINPANGLKRLISLRMLKDTLKNLVKLVVYAALAWFLIKQAVQVFGDALVDANRLGQAMASGARRLLFAFIGAAAFFTIVDQLIARGEFRKQMRMSRRELTQEVREREGEPRLKQKRRRLHEELRKQTEGLGRVAGSDVLITNPEHYAIALKYEPGSMAAPVVRARGRNHFAQLLKRKARIAGVPIIADPGLARALYADCRPDQPISPAHFHAVARHYARLRKPNPSTEI